MFGIGSTELLVILLVALVVLGPKSLSSISRSLGKVVGEFRRVSTDFQRTLNAEVALEEEKEKQRKAEQASAAASAQTAESAMTSPTDPANPPSGSALESALNRTATEAAGDSQTTRAPQA